MQQLYIPIIPVKQYPCCFAWELIDANLDNHLHIYYYSTKHMLSFFLLKYQARLGLAQEFLLSDVLVWLWRDLITDQGLALATVKNALLMPFPIK